MQDRATIKLTSKWVYKKTCNWWSSLLSAAIKIYFDSNFCTPTFKYWSSSEFSLISFLLHWVSKIYFPSKASVVRQLTNNFNYWPILNWIPKFIQQAHLNFSQKLQSIRFWKKLLSEFSTLNSILMFLTIPTGNLRNTLKLYLHNWNQIHSTLAAKFSSKMLPVLHLSLPLKAVVTEYCKLGSLQNIKNVFLVVLWRLEVKDQGNGRFSLLDHRKLFSCCVLTWCKAQELSLVSKSRYPIHHITTQRSHLQIKSP